MSIKGIGAFKNLGRVYLAQAVSFGLTCIMTLYTPKFLGITQFSYWQLFLLYTSYTGLVQLGLNDGVYLRYGGKHLTIQDKQILSGQFFILSAVVFIIFLTICSIFLIKSHNPVYQWLCLFICIYGFVYNVNGYLVYLLQSTNMIKLYARSLIVDKVFLIIAIIALGIVHCKDYRIVAIVYTAGTVLADIIMISRSNRAVLTPFNINRSIFIEISENIRAGFPLMLSGIASSLIIGVCRFMISGHYPINTFGIVSLAFTLTVFVLGFISQVGMVIYPLLKNKDSQFHRDFFPKVDCLIDLIIPFTFVLLPIISIIITHYLPKYTDSIPYFFIVFPLCMFETKNSALLNTYMKVFRKERTLLMVNFISFIFSLTFCSIAIYLLDSIPIALISVTCSILLKSQIMRNIIAKDLEIKTKFSTNIFIIVCYYFLYFIDINLYAIVGIMILISIIILSRKRKDALDAITIFVNRSTK